MNRQHLNDYLLEMEEREKEFESDFERFVYGLTDQDLDILLDRRDRAIDMNKELK